MEDLTKSNTSTTISRSTLISSTTGSPKLNGRLVQIKNIIE